MAATTTLFRDRKDAGKVLALELARFADEHPIILGLARGGVVVAAEVALALNAELDVLVARKLGAPHQHELGIGAVAPNGIQVLDSRLIAKLEVSHEAVDLIAARAWDELNQRNALYHSTSPPLSVKGRTVILVDDGLATGVTALAAVRSLKASHAARVVAAFPIASVQGAKLIRAEADEVVCVAELEDMFAVGAWYADFTQVSDEAVINLLNGHLTNSTETTRELKIDVGDGVIVGDLTCPTGAQGVVLFAHGTGSGRLSPRNRFVAGVLNQAGFATLLLDLLTESEAQEDEYSGHIRFDIGLLADRLHRATAWVKDDPDTQALPVGYFGASTGAAAALVSSVKNPATIKAIVSRGGRPDLAGPVLAQVTAPTLLIVGTKDEEVIELNRSALNTLSSQLKHLSLVEGATHLFEEAGALEQVADLASHWFAQHLH
jgi:putative phosphoribosyl transferase